MKTITDKKVIENDIWEFYTVLQDLKFKAKGIIYYENGSVSERLTEQANNCNIELKKFNLMDAVKESVLKAVQIMLPDNKVIGDPFWLLMETFTKDGKEQTNGNYVQFDGEIPLFLSYKQAQVVCEARNKVHPVRAKVFGLSQNQLKVLIGILEAQKFPVQIGIVLPEFEQPKGERVAVYSIDSEKLLKYYYREN